MRKIAAVIQNDNEGVNVIDTIKMTKNAGFKDVFIQWYDEFKITKERQLMLCKEADLNIIFAHLGYKNINAIWEEGPLGDKLVEKYKKNIYECKCNGISLVVMHLIGTIEKSNYNSLGLGRLREIVMYAKQLDVKIAFENTKRIDYLEYVLQNIKEDNVGVCFDFGHCHAYSNDYINIELFKNRIFAVHIHDNDKTNDLHLLPFDGTIDWALYMSALIKCDYDGPITLEMCYRGRYMNLELKEFLRVAYEKGSLLSNMIEFGNLCK